VTPAPDERDVQLIAVTGVGVLTPLGDTLEAVASALATGRSAVEPDAELAGTGMARLKDFDATRYANVRGLRLYSRPTRLAICAVKLALGDARLDQAAMEPEQLGTVTASTFGHLETLIEYDRAVVTSGLARANPALMPLSLPSTPGAAIALAFGAKAFSISLADAGVSSLDALGLGARLLQAGRARTCVVVGTFSPTAELAISAMRAGMLAPADAFRVFDRRHRGTALGEGAAAFVLERSADAEARGVQPSAFVTGQVSTFAPDAADVPTALRRACDRALRAAGVAPSEVGLVSAGADGSPHGDRDEARALIDLLGSAAGRTPVTAVKASFGDTLDAAGLLQAAVALAALRSGKAPPIAHLEEPDVAGLAYITRERVIEGRHALVTSRSQTGACSALVLSARHA